MKEIINRLHENRQIELAKEILESAGYKVEKLDEVGYYGSDLENEFAEIREKDPSIEDLVYELGMEDEIFPEDEEQVPSDESYRKIIQAYKKRKGKISATARQSSMPVSDIAAGLSSKGLDVEVSEFNGSNYIHIEVNKGEEQEMFNAIKDVLKSLNLEFAKSKYTSIFADRKIIDSDTKKKIGSYGHGASYRGKEDFMIKDFY